MNRYEILKSFLMVTNTMMLNTCSFDANQEEQKSLLDTHWLRYKFKEASEDMFIGDTVPDIIHFDATSKR